MAFVISQGEYIYGRGDGGGGWGCNPAWDMVVVPGLHAVRGARVGKGDQPLTIHASNPKAMDHVTLEMHKDI